MKNVLQQALKEFKESGADDRFSGFFVYLNRIAERQGNFGLRYLEAVEAAVEMGIAYRDSGFIWRVKI